jgi:hypothetical protein
MVKGALYRINAGNTDKHSLDLHFEMCERMTQQGLCVRVVVDAVWRAKAWPQPA